MGLEFRVFFACSRAALADRANSLAALVGARLTGRDAARPDTYMDVGVASVGFKMRGGKKGELKLRTRRSADVGWERWVKTACKAANARDLLEPVRAERSLVDYDAAVAALSSDDAPAMTPVVVHKSRVNYAVGAVALEEVDLDVTVADAAEPRTFRSICVEGAQSAVEAFLSKAKVRAFLLERCSAKPSASLAHVARGFPQFVGDCVREAREQADAPPA